MRRQPTCSPSTGTESKVVIKGVTYMMAVTSASPSQTRPAKKRKLVVSMKQERKSCRPRHWLFSIAGS